MEKDKTISLSLDLEDWSWDYKYMLGLTCTDNNNANALFYAVKKFKNLHVSLGATTKDSIVYVTGNLIENYPAVVRYASICGFKIGCHCYHHLNVKKREIVDLRNDFEFFFSVAGQNRICIEPIFRAPMFTVHKNDIDHLKLIFEYFDIESGVIESHSSEIGRHLPVTKVSFLGLSFNLGGTFLSWMPVILVKILSKYLKSKRDIHVYLHPYELVEKPLFAISYSEFRSKYSISKSLYYFLRQRQWNNRNGRKIVNKINILKIDRKFKNGIEAR